MPRARQFGNIERDPFTENLFAYFAGVFYRCAEGERIDVFEHCANKSRQINGALFIDEDVFALVKASRRNR